jgi:hypothetical protein
LFFGIAHLERPLFCALSFPSLYLSVQLILLALWRKKRSIIVATSTHTPSLSSSWEQKPQDVNPSAAAELTRSFKAKSVVVV